MTINATASVLLCMYIAVAEAQGVAPKQLTGTIQNDILKEYVAGAPTSSRPPPPCDSSPTPSPSARRNCLAGTASASALPRSGSRLDGGAGGGLHPGGRDRVRRGGRRGGPRRGPLRPAVALLLHAHNHLLEEVPIPRRPAIVGPHHARAVWRQGPARVGAALPRADAGSTLTAQQPENNVVRVAVAGPGRVLGGAQSLHTNSRDEALGLPTEDAVRIALRTQQILAHESGRRRHRGPAGRLVRRGSADTRSRRRPDYLDKIDRMAGMLRAIEMGFVAEEITGGCVPGQRRWKKSRQVVVGAMSSSARRGRVPVFVVDERLGGRAVRATPRGRARRDAVASRPPCGNWRRSRAETGNLLPPILEAVGPMPRSGKSATPWRRVRRPPGNGGA